MDFYIRMSLFIILCICAGDVSDKLAWDKVSFAGGNSGIGVEVTLAALK